MATEKPNKTNVNDLPYQRIHTFFYKWQRTLVIMVGHDFYPEVFRFTVMSFVTYFFIIAFVICSMNTIIMCDVWKKLEGFAYMCLLCGVSVLRITKNKINFKFLKYFSILYSC